MVYVILTNHPTLPSVTTSRICFLSPSVKSTVMSMLKSTNTPLASRRASHHNGPTWTDQSVHHDAFGCATMKTSTFKRSRRPTDESLLASRQNEILEAAARLFAKRGYAETDTQLLADQLGVGKGTLYRYFPSKEQLFLAAVDRAMNKLREHIDARIVNVEDPLDQIAEAIRAYLEFSVDHPELVELLMQERAQFKDRKKPTYFEHREAYIEPWRARYRALIAAGRVREMPVECITDVLSQLLYGTLFVNYFVGQRKPPEIQAQEILDVVFDGILSDTERRRRRPSSDANRNR